MKLRSSVRARTAICGKALQSFLACISGAKAAHINAMSMMIGNAVPERRTTMIKGKYVAMVEIDISIDENKPGLMPFDEMKEYFYEHMENETKALMEEELGDEATVRIITLAKDMYRVEEDNDD